MTGNVIGLCQNGSLVEGMQRSIGRVDFAIIESRAFSNWIPHLEARYHLSSSAMFKRLHWEWRDIKTVVAASVDLAPTIKVTAPL